MASASIWFQSNYLLILYTLHILKLIWNYGRLVLGQLGCSAEQCKWHFLLEFKCAGTHLPTRGSGSQRREVRPWSWFLHSNCDSSPMWSSTTFLSFLIFISPKNEDCSIHFKRLSWELAEYFCTWWTWILVGTLQALSRQLWLSPYQMLHAREGHMDLWASCSWEPQRLLGIFKISCPVESSLSHFYPQPILLLFCGSQSWDTIYLEFKDRCSINFNWWWWPNADLKLMRETQRGLNWKFKNALWIFALLLD